MVRWTHPITRTSSPGLGVLVTLTNTLASVPVSAAVLSRSEYDERIQLADRSALRRSPTGALMNRLLRTPEFKREMVGGVSVALPALRNDGDPNSWNARVVVAAGPSGIRVTAIAGEFASIGIRPVATSTRCQTSTPGISSGVPVPLKLVMSASPTR